MKSSICLKNGDLYLPLEKMKSENLVFAVCMRAMYINKIKLVEGVNSLEKTKLQLELIKQTIVQSL